MISLRDYQEAAIASSLESPLQRQMIVLPTGGGKTFTCLALAKRMGVRTLWLAHTEELVSQPSKSMALVWPEVSFGIVKADLNQYMRHVVFASVQSAQQDKRIAQLAEQNFGLVVIDECHRSLATGYRKIVEALGCFREGGPRLIGLTATPERSDNGALDEIFQGIVFHLGINSAIDRGYLIAPTVVEHSINIDLDAVTIQRGDFGAKQLDLALMKAGIVDEIAKAYAANCQGKRKTIVFVVSVEQAHAVADALTARGVRAAAISGETDKEERRSILRKLKSGEIECVTNCAVLTEGFDEPSVDCVILARPTQSKTLMIQCVGRCLRLHPGKTDALVVDMVGVTKRSNLVQAAVIFGLKPDPNEKPKAVGLDPIADAEAYWIQRLATQIKGVKGAPRSKLRWLPTHDNAGWLLSAGEFGTIRMLPSEEDWIVDVIGANSGERFSKLSDAPVNLETAQAIAEDYVRRVKAVQLASGGSKWRDEPASDAQKALLKRNGIRADGLTKGTASDLTTQLMAKKATEPASAKQIYFLRRNGVNVGDGISKRDASRKIAELRGATR